LLWSLPLLRVAASSNWENLFCFTPFPASTGPPYGSSWTAPPWRYELGVEIVTVYLPMADMVNPPARIAELLAWTQEQYKRLASLPEHYAFTAEDFTSEAVLQALENAPEMIGRSSAI